MAKWRDITVEGIGFLLKDAEELGRAVVETVEEGVGFALKDAEEFVQPLIKGVEKCRELGATECAGTVVELVKEAASTVGNDCFKDKTTVQDYNPPDPTALQYSTFKDASTNVRLIEGLTYRENRVRLSTFSILPPQLKAEVPQNLKTKRSLQLHPLALKRLKLMNEAWMKEYGGKEITSQSGGRLTTSTGKPLAIASGYRDVGEAKFKYLLNVNDSRTRKAPAVVNAVKLGEKNVKRLFEIFLISEYGSVSKGRKLLAWHSPHGTGLAMDFGRNGLEPKSKTNSAQKKTTLFLWLKDNAHKFGLSPYTREAWHWEVLVPRENWSTGQEFVQNENYNIRVVEEGVKTKLKTTNRKFPEEFAV
ncbi:MAG: hypothetical protein CMB97_08165 [Flavobacteriaceae bacterium]|nr:hypothetical protein [Flavobacteriaceae bacterium]